MHLNKTKEHVDSFIKLYTIHLNQGYDPDSATRLTNKILGAIDGGSGAQASGEKNQAPKAPQRPKPTTKGSQPHVARTRKPGPISSQVSLAVAPGEEKIREIDRVSEARNRKERLSYLLDRVSNTVLLTVGKEVSAGTKYTTTKTLIDRTGFARSTVQTALEVWVGRGIVERRGRTEGSGFPIGYRLTEKGKKAIVSGPSVPPGPSQLNMELEATT